MTDFDNDPPSNEYVFLADYEIHVDVVILHDGEEDLAEWLQIDLNKSPDQEGMDGPSSSVSAKVMRLPNRMLDGIWDR